MTNPYSAGGGGTHLEARVVAAALAAVLCEAPFRGLLGCYATEVLSQRGAFNAPLDDLVLGGINAGGIPTKLHLQIKNDLTFTDKDDEWADVLGRAWDTFSAQDFDGTTTRYGVGIGTYNARVDRHYQTVLKWAVDSTDGNYFLERIEKKDFSHQDKRAFVQNVRLALAKKLSREVTNDELWRFLKGLVILHFDFQSGAGSRDASNVIDRLNGLLSPSDRGQAEHVWNILIAKAGEFVPVGGGAARSTLIQQFAAEGLPTGTAPSLWKDIQRIDSESQKALGDIKSHVANLRLHREGPFQEIAQALEHGRFVQIIGEPGSGKSAILKELAQEAARVGPVFVLKDGRVHPRGWGHMRMSSMSAMT